MAEFVTDASVPFTDFSNTTIISPLSGSKCLADIHFLTDSSHFKGRGIFTNWLTRNSGVQLLCNEAPVFLDEQCQEKAFVLSLKSNLLTKTVFDSIPCSQ